MAKDHWDKAVDASNRVNLEDVAAPELGDDLERIAERITQSAAKNPESINDILSSEEAAQKIDDADPFHIKRNEQRRERREQYEADRAEADEANISVGELRQRRRDEANADTVEGEAKGEVDPIEEANQEVEPLAQIIQLLTAIAADTAQIREKLGEDGEQVVHG